MIMDVEMHSSPTFRTARTSASPCKRPRSPPSSPSPLERPSKRISFGVHGSVSLPLAHLGVGAGPASSSSSLRTRQVSNEDWVAQTRGLRLASNSPIVEQEMVLEEGMVEDDVMNVENTVDPSVGSSFACPPNSPERPLQACTTPDSSLSIPFHGALHFQNVSQPMSSFQPPAAFSLSRSLSSSSSVPETVMRCTTPELDPRTIPLPVSPVAARKQRFTMGPRADCEKCRSGVKGHWVHLD
ncbi:hypothetical protein BXZ70DRAFT_926908 [Cristinia sonorae]|uniref:Uncharacterized protein n=1 Tax=Cristinia sonorae TaxID=1940300 RepID=A0A8K0XRU6_9AGAR|nr:hypothetical protein BXZ70DRAFT_926908 [Cristinia sonorae]